MKRINIFLSAIVATAIIMTACTNDKPKDVKLGSEIDSLNYALGYANGKIIKQYHLKSDSAGKEAIKMLMKGIQAGLKEEVAKPDVQAVVEFGSAIGNQLKTSKDFFGDSSLTINYALIRQGLINGISGEEKTLKTAEAQLYFNTTMEKIQAKKNEKLYKGNLIAGETFLAENAKKPGVITTPSGLQYEIIKKGNGPLPTDTSHVTVNYHGTLVDGTVFDSSVDRKTPAKLRVNQVIKGWTEALQLMPVGSKFKLYVPQGLAYGSEMRGAIKPFSMLIFEVELISIDK